MRYGREYELATAILDAKAHHLPHMLKFGVRTFIDCAADQILCLSVCGMYVTFVH